MDRKKTAFHGYLSKLISEDSVDLLKRDDRYEDMQCDCDPLMLWILIEDSHKVESLSKAVAVVRGTARNAYHSSLRQHPWESIVNFKERFVYILAAYKAQGNPVMAEVDIAMDFFNWLDSARYADFKIETLNDIEKGKMAQPESLTEMYTLAQSHLVKAGGPTHDGTHGTAYATTVDLKKKKKKIPRDEESSDEDGPPDWLKKVECYTCHQ